MSIEYDEGDQVKIELGRLTPKNLNHREGETNAEAYLRYNKNQSTTGSFWACNVIREQQARIEELEGGELPADVLDSIGEDAKETVRLINRVEELEELVQEYGRKEIKS